MLCTYDSNFNKNVKIKHTMHYVVRKIDLLNMNVKCITILNKILRRNWIHKNKFLKITL